MAQVASSAIINDIIAVLRHASCGKGGDVGYLTAYQIFNRLPAGTKAILEAAYGPSSGGGAGHHFSPATRVAQVASEIDDIDQKYLDTGGLNFVISANPNDPNVPAGFNLCALFRLPFGHPLRNGE